LEGLLEHKRRRPDNRGQSAVRDAHERAGTLTTAGRRDGREGLRERSELLVDQLPCQCVVCAGHATVRPFDAVRRPRIRADVPKVLPPLELCDEHWRAYETDWLLLGWCVDHYGEGLQRCMTHDREIEPL